MDVKEQGQEWEGRRGKNRAVAIGLVIFVLLVFVTTLVRMKGGTA